MTTATAAVDPATTGTGSGKRFVDRVLRLREASIIGALITRSTLAGVT